MCVEISDSKKFEMKTRKNENLQDSGQIKDNLLALGIDIDQNLIERMQKLGLSSSLQSTSKIASSVRSRNPYGISSAILYRNIEDPTESLYQEKKEIEQEWSRVDTQRIYQILSELYQSIDSNLVAVQRMIHILRIQYARSEEKFIDYMLFKKYKMGHLKTNDIIRTRYTQLSMFIKIIQRLYKHASITQIEILFNMLSQNVEVNGLPKVVVDLKAFLFLLKIAHGDSRRTFIDKTSNISLDVEFWNQKRAIIPNGTTNSPSKPRIVHINGQDICSSKGYILHEMFTNESNNSP